MSDTNSKNDKKLEINGGAFLIARQIFESEIWLNKPSSWKIIWIYIFGKVNHSDNKIFKKGEGFFNFSQELKMIGIDITYDNIRHCLQFLKISKMVSTTKSTRGMIIKVNNYNKYQTLLNYKSTTKSTNPSTIKAQQKHNESTTINKNDKNDKNDKNNKNNTLQATPAEEIIPDLINDKQKHIQIIGLWARAKKINFTGKAHQQSFIRRNLRAAQNLVPYDIDRIMETMAYLIKNADFKSTLESVGKFIDEDLVKLYNKNKTIII